MSSRAARPADPATTPSKAHDAFSGDATVNAVAGAGAASIVLAALFPIDSAKTHAQARGLTLAETWRGIRASESPLRRAYRGFSPALCEQALNRSMLFGVGALIKNHLIPAEWPEPMRDMSSGAAAAFAKTSVLHPLDTVKCRWQLGMPLHQLDGLYGGFVPAQLRSSVGMGIWLASRNQLERSLPHDGAYWPSVRHLVAGALSSLLTDLCTFPMDTLKKAMQADGSRASAAPSFLTTVTRLRAEGGVPRFYAGYGARFVMISVNGALFNAAFVALKARLEVSWPAATALLGLA